MQIQIILSIFIIVSETHFNYNYLFFVKLELINICEVM